MTPTFSKISLSKFNPDVPHEDQTCGLSLDFSEEITNEAGDFEFAKESKQKLKNFFCHNDLMENFRKLRSHLSVVCELYKSETVTGLDDVDAVAPKIYVTGVTMTGGGEGEGVVMVGFKVLQSGGRLNLVSPNVKFDEYEHAEHLMNILSELEREAAAAHKGKRKVIQGDLFETDWDAIADGGTDDEFDEPSDPIESIKEMKASLKSKGIKASITANGRTVEF